MRRRGAADGFTLTELLTVVTVLGLLTGLLTVQVRTARWRSQRQACLANLRQVCVGYVLYAADHAGLLPPKYEIKKKTLSASDRAEGRVLNTIGNGIQTALYPYVGDVRVFRCPADSGDAKDDAPLWTRRGESYEVKGVLKKDLGTAKATFFTKGGELVAGDPFKPWEAEDPLTVMEKIAKGEHGPKDWHHGYANLVLPSGAAYSVRTKEEEKAVQDKE
ncbi:MAG: prepilin-type N-terminal cleavage/methylation domain-containing protein [Kiritimatiellae bacterium]|nr:prepilin-type N-terminal cleavage/methylation domain-containing protein [Kiritimatiellia bacterium]